MKYYRKIIILLTTVILTGATLTACGGDETENPPAQTASPRDMNEQRMYQDRRQLHNDPDRTEPPRHPDGTIG